MVASWDHVEAFSDTDSRSEVKHHKKHHKTAYGARVFGCGGIARERGAAATLR
jgi:hypothetical protein